MKRVSDEYARDGKAELFRRLQPCLTGALDFTDSLATNYPQRFYRGLAP